MDKVRAWLIEHMEKDDHPTPVGGPVRVPRRASFADVKALHDLLHQFEVKVPEEAQPVTAGHAVNRQQRRANARAKAKP